MSDPGEQGLVGDWVVGQVIGRGPRSVVHEGHHRLHPDRRVAIKLVAGPDPEGDEVATILREARVLQELSHPAILPFVDVVADADGVALVTPLARGSLRARLDASGVLPWDEVADVGARLADGLAAAHAVGIIHRDVTPSNILFGHDLDPRLADFGASLLRDDDGRIVGTPGYMAPEVAAGEPASPRADVYSLGVVLYECLAGQSPWPGTTPQAIIRAADRGMHLPLGDVAPTVPANLVAIVTQAMARDPEQRFAGAKALHAALAQAALAAGQAASVVDPKAPLPAPPAWAPSPPVPVVRPPDRAEDLPLDGSSAMPAPTTDFGPRPMPPIEVDEPARPWWVTVLAVMAVAVPVAIATWAFATRGGPLPTPTPSEAATSSPTAAAVPITPSASPVPAPTPTPTSVPTPTPIPTPTIEPTLPTGARLPTGWSDWEPKRACRGQPRPGPQATVVDVAGRGCGVVVRRVQDDDGVYEIVVPASAGALAGRYSFNDRRGFVVFGDWNGNGVETPALVAGARGQPVAYMNWLARVPGEQVPPVPIDEPIGAAEPRVVTDPDGVDHVVPARRRRVPAGS